MKSIERSLKAGVLYFYDASGHCLTIISPTILVPFYIPTQPEAELFILSALSVSRAANTNYH